MRAGDSERGALLFSSALRLRRFQSKASKLLQLSFLRAQHGVLAKRCIFRLYKNTTSLVCATQVAELIDTFSRIVLLVLHGSVVPFVRINLSRLPVGY